MSLFWQRQASRLQTRPALQLRKMRRGLSQTLRSAVCKGDGSHKLEVVRSKWLRDPGVQLLCVPSSKLCAYPECGLRIQRVKYWVEQLPSHLLPLSPCFCVCFLLSLRIWVCCVSIATPGLCIRSSTRHSATTATGTVSFEASFKPQKGSSEIIYDLGRGFSRGVSHDAWVSGGPLSAS